MFCQNCGKNISYLQRLKNRLKIYFNNFNKGITLEEDRRKKYALIFSAFIVLNELIWIIIIIGFQWELKTKDTELNSIFSLMLIFVLILYSMSILEYIGVYYWNACKKRKYEKNKRQIIPKILFDLSADISILEILLIARICSTKFSYAFYMLFFAFDIFGAVIKIIFTILYCKAAECEALNIECEETYKKLKG